MPEKQILPKKGELIAVAAPWSRFHGRLAVVRYIDNPWGFDRVVVNLGEKDLDRAFEPKDVVILSKNVQEELIRTGEAPSLSN
jgi:hypothetical protein